MAQRTMRGAIFVVVMATMLVTVRSETVGTADEMVVTREKEVTQETMIGEGGAEAMTGTEEV